jgi:transposase InsO family protein
VLDRQFTATRPNQRWIADFAYIWTAEGWLYVAAVIDLFSRRVVGWSMKAEMTAQLVTDALIMAIWRRGKAPSRSTLSIIGEIGSQKCASALRLQCFLYWQSPLPLRQLPLVTLGRGNK